MGEENTVAQKKVCIVDDTAEIRGIYSIKFTREGFAVVTAKDGVEALQVIKEERPDVILLDIQMPVLDGLGVLKALKADSVLSKIPVVILSNVNQDDMFQKISDLGGAQYYLVKSLTTPQKIIDITLDALAGR